MVEEAAPISESEKHEAIEVAVASQTFARSAQLRALLRYLCEKEIAGRSEEISEHSIAVEVLGRKEYFSDESAVRNRLYELRQRLERLYASELRSAGVRIDIPRGTYVPTYRRFEPGPCAPSIEEGSAAPAPHARQAPFRRVFWIALAAAAGVSLVAGWMAGSLPGRTRLPEILAEAWGPMAEPADDMLIAVATDLHLLVRPHIPAAPDRTPAPKEMYPLFRQSRPLADGEVLYMEPAQIAVPFGYLTASTVLARTRSAFGGSYQILPEAEAPISALLGRNSALLGLPTNSQAATLLLEDTPLTVGFAPDDSFSIVDRRKPAGQDRVFVARWMGPNATSTVFGLLTVKSGINPAGKPRRTVSLTGTGSPGVLAAASFFSSPDHLSDLKQHFEAGGLRGFPPNYQVVIRCRANELRLLSYEYATHIVLTK
jgi:hypothetical protein